MPRPRKQQPAALPNPNSDSEEDIQNSNSKRQKNLEEKTFFCPCGKAYRSVAAWHTHFRKKHQKTDPNAKQVHEEFYRSVRVGNVLSKPQLIKELPLFTHNIPTNVEESKHTTNADNTYARICSTWREQQGELGLVSIDDVQWNRQTDSIDAEVKSFEDITTVRKEALKMATQELVEQYELYDLIKKVKDRNEFWDYRALKGELVLNFSWDILVHFKTEFAAKILCIIQSLCVPPQILEQYPGWKKFKTYEWQKYSFIDEILKDYQREWQKFTRSHMHFI